ncbi:MAG: hypothetical protein KKB31_08040 [Nanoarchaeota archaeon]|nr:hypothetical protein [Nanoarchaeota archaeon]
MNEQGTTSERTAKVEAGFVAELRREAPIKTEVIVELREQNRALWESQARLLSALIAAEDALRVYRALTLERSIACGSSDSKCVPGCDRHRWDDADGWHRTAEVPHD